MFDLRLESVISTYMFIDHNHLASEYVRDGVSRGQTKEILENLIFGQDNPLGRSLIYEYQRFFSVDLDRYDLVIDFQEFRALEAGQVEQIAQFLNVPHQSAGRLMQDALGAPTWTKNSGAINVFTSLPDDYLVDLEGRVADAEQLGASHA